METSVRFCLTFVTLGFAGIVSAQVWTGPAEAIRLPGCENAFRVGAKIISGGEPHSEEAFQSLTDAGVKTIISVDGAQPNLELAKKHGMRYVHLPIAYEGIEQDRALEIGRAVRDLDGPVYMHCHHGKHRGPAAAAVALIGAEGWSNEEAVAFLTQAGTSDKYKGLYAIAASFALPTPDALDTASAEFPEVAVRSDMVEAMAAMDRHFDNLALAAGEDFNVPKEHPDIVPTHEALQLHETFFELIRLNADADWPAEMRQWMSEGEALSRELNQALRTGAGRPPAELMVDLRKNCSACHDVYRNNK